MTTDRMFKTFFWAVRNKKTMNANNLLHSPKAYMQYYSMCYSKICGNSSRRNKSVQNITKEDVENYLKRCQWIHM